jgi:hypothetical protein
MIIEAIQKEPTSVYGSFTFTQFIRNVIMPIVNPRKKVYTTGKYRLRDLTI